MKLIYIAILGTILSGYRCASIQPDPSSTILSGFSIVYDSSVEDEMGIGAAKEIASAISIATGEDLPIVADTLAPSKRRIFVGCSSEASLGTFDYEVYPQKGDLVVNGGGCWAIKCAASEIGEKLRNGVPLRKMNLSGNAYGIPLFADREGLANLRILDCNIWQYDNKTPPEAWTELGLSPCNDVRSVNLAAIAKAYLPDIFCIQEYSKSMDRYLRPLLAQAGLKLTFAPDSAWSFTPILYDPTKIELIECGSIQHEPKEYNNASTKSFNFLVGRMRSGEGRFIIVNTHLWWKNEKVQPGSDDARAAQAKRILEFISDLCLRYPDTPVFFMGDMNCTIESDAMRLVLDDGFKPVWDVAEIFGDKTVSHHYCKPDGFGRHGYGKTIDLAFVKGGASIKSFRRITAWFTVHTTDHYPNYIDAVVR